MGLFSIGRRSGSRDPMRESAAMTTVYLLEWNRKFEQFLRAKVGELEARVAAQQSRLSTQAETEAREIWVDELPLLDDLEEGYTEAETAPYLDGFDDTLLGVEAAPPVVEEHPVLVNSADYLSLLGVDSGDKPPAKDEWANAEISDEVATTPVETLPEIENLESVRVNEVGDLEILEDKNLDEWHTELPDAVPEDYVWPNLD